MNSPRRTILIVEDEAHDVELIQLALERAGIDAPVFAASNGEDAIAYLSGTPPYSDRGAHPLPSMIITDLKMPQMGGLELLRWLREHPRFRALPTIVLTSSSAPKDVSLAFELGARGYMVKPVSLTQLEKTLRTVAIYWQLSLLPSESN